MKNHFKDIGEAFEKRATSTITARDRVPKYRTFFVEAFKVLEPSTRYKHNWHIDYLCDILEDEVDRIYRGLPKQKGDFVVNLMFRSLKSYIFTIILNAYAWAKYPSLKFITGSYSKDLAVEHSFKTKKLISSSWYQDNFGGSFQILGDQNSKEYFMNDAGGERKAVSVGGQVTGSGGNIFIIDDPVKPPEKLALGFSESDIKKANNWWDNTAFNRINDPLVDIRIIVMQRIMNNDLSSHVLKAKKNKTTHISIPGELRGKNPMLNPPELEKLYKPDIHDPKRKMFFVERMPSTVIDAYEDTMGPQFSPQVLQNPKTDEGVYWTEQMFVPIPREEIPSFTIEYTAWDLATSEKRVDSSSAFVHGGVFDGIPYIDDFGYFWKKYEAMVSEIKMKKQPHVIEYKSSGIQAIDTLHKLGIYAEKYDNNNRDKIYHTQTTVPLISKKCKFIYVAEDIYHDFVNGEYQGLTHFPNSVKDDVNDAFCILIQMLAPYFKTLNEFKDNTPRNRGLINSPQRQGFGRMSANFKGGFLTSPI
jgi:phage terminase large subunit-like protein